MHTAARITIMLAAALVVAYPIAISSLLLIPDHRLAAVENTGSMEPALRGGDLVLQSTQRTPRVGEIVSVRRKSGSVIHRVAEIAPDGTLQLKGDANPIPDLRPDPPEAVQGTVIQAMPMIGWPILWLHQGSIFVRVLVIAAPFLAAWILIYPRALRADSAIATAA